MPARRYVAAAKVGDDRRARALGDPRRLTELERAQRPVALDPVEDRLPVRDDEVRPPTAELLRGPGYSLGERLPEAGVELADLLGAGGSGRQRASHRRPELRALGAYFVTYLQEVVGLDPTTAILANFTAFFVTVPLVPLIGALGDRIGRKPLLFIGSAGFIVLSVPGYMIAGSGGLATAMLGQLLVALPWSFVVSAVVVTLVEIFPTRVRYSGASVGYNVAYMIFGGTAPLVATYLVSATGSDIAPGFYLVVVAVVVFFVAFALPETRGLSLLREGEERPEGTLGAAGARPS